MSSKYIGHAACPDCGSSDGLALHDDNHTYCHVCKTYKRNPEDAGVVTTVKKPMNKDLTFYDAAITSAIGGRGITSTTCLKYGVRQSNDKHFYPYYDNEGTLTAVKTRYVETKDFKIAGDFNAATLFGQNLFPANGKYLTICEGELDALAAYQMTGSKYPAISIRNGASAALKDCKTNF